MDDCHVGSTTFTDGHHGQVSTPSLHPTTGPVAGSGPPMGPRHVSYELHLPNAPPLSA